MSARCPECGGPVLDLLREEARERLQVACEWLHAQTLERVGLCLMRRETRFNQGRNAFELGREIGRMEAGDRRLQVV